MISLTRGLKRFQIDGEVAEAEAGASPSAAGSVLRPERAYRAGGLFRHSRDRGRRIGDECRGLGRRIEGRLLSVTFMNERGERGGKAPVETPVLLSEPGFSAFLDHPEGTFQLEKGKKEEILERMKSYSEMRKKIPAPGLSERGFHFQKPERRPCRKMDRRSRAERIQDRTGHGLRPPRQFHRQSGKGHG